MSDHFRILVVCTGNICRSAQAEQFIRARILENFPGLTSVVLVESAGTGAMVGSGMPDEAAVLSVQHGGIPTNHIARQLTADQVRAADLVLAMATEHRSGVVRLLPRASRITFTLTEFSALLESAEQNRPALPADFPALNPADKLRVAVKWASARRGFLPPEDASPSDVVDPYRRSEEVYAESTRQILQALDRAQRAAVRLARGVSA
ncbi:low molecular weight phosphatase family protein [Nesterenkonia sp. E16_7]|uniref:arsenate reductase/protein-tyrosine-phosphatase family protein n=1 Tax=unclassified Nesterenkonia TaxID=2629769 RepID=UPI001A92E71F|nr:MULTISPECIES: low molecular weight phosphatase family protein [unclassified Nesterenkonia]MBO0594586.1 low molecular weight phosphatase family protein [Nesterenkonia sp. E16_10]MBO0599779.1 low molecular weight phosphatase family protein [Nesterenkonia sp. E16_7]